MAIRDKYAGYVGPDYADEEAFPTSSVIGGGLTRREYFAIHCITQQDYHCQRSVEDVAARAVKLADALLGALKS